MGLKEIIGILLLIIWVGVIGYCLYRYITNWAQHYFGKRLYKFKEAKFVENIYGDMIFYYNCRSIWKIKYWPFYLKTDELYDNKKHIDYCINNRL